MSTWNDVADPRDDDPSVRADPDATVPGTGRRPADPTS